ncbi:MAG: BspA family leucine-rich repeat surface protein [Prevotella sp.]|nr:BspA family leucine-rich repeat surface protein [Prevotella sp.]
MKKLRFIMATLLAVVGFMSAHAAEKEAYVVFNSTSGTLTFYYDANRSNHDAIADWVYGLNTGSNAPGWLESATSVKKVSFHYGFKDYKPTTMYRWFFGMTNLTKFEDEGKFVNIDKIEYLNTENVTNMFQTFGGCSSLTSLDFTIFTNFSTAKVTTMRGMFFNCLNLQTLNISNFSTPELTDVSGMFMGCEKLQSVSFPSTFTTSNVTDMSFLFSDCESLQTVAVRSSFTTENVTDMREMFYGCKSVDGLVFSTFNTAKVTDMSGMFQNCTKLTGLDLRSFSTSNVTNMSSMFNGCSAMTVIMLPSSFSLYMASDVSALFKNCSSLVSLNTEAIIGSAYNNKNASGMFQGCSKLSQINLTNFNNDHVYDMSYMFDGCSNLTKVTFSSTQNKSGLDMTYKYMFRGCSKLTTIENICYTTSREYRQDNRDMTGMFEGCSSLTSLDLSAVKYNQYYYYLNATDMFSGCSSLTSLAMWDDVRLDNCSGMFNGCEKLASIDLSGFNTEKVTDMSNMFNGCKALTSLDVSTFNTDGVTNMSYMFAGCKALTSIDVSPLNTEKVTDVSGMFSGCSSLTELDLSTFDTRSVTKTAKMFYNCPQLTTIYITTLWDVTGVTAANSTQMFDGCSLLKGSNGTAYAQENNGGGAYAVADGEAKGYLSYRPYVFLTDGTLTFINDGNRRQRTGVTTYDLKAAGAQPAWTADAASISNVTIDPSFAFTRPTSTRSWFEGMSALKDIEGIGNLNTEEVTNMSAMFSGCTGLTQLDLMAFNTSKVTTMTSMFANCTGLTVLDLSAFNTGNVAYAHEMFYKCNQLVTIHVGDGWDMSHVDTYMGAGDMFEGCTKLVGEYGKTYNYYDINRWYAIIGTEGYLTSPAYAVYDNRTLTFYCDQLGSTRSGQVFRLNVGLSTPKWNLDEVKNNVRTVVFDASFAKANPQSTYRWFEGLRRVNKITDMDNMNTANVTTMRQMFSGCESLENLDVSMLNTENVTDMNSMFSGCDYLSILDLSTFNTKKVTDMAGMFSQCTDLTTVNVGQHWSTDAVTSSEGMFDGCSSIEGRLGTTYDAAHTDKAYAHVDAPDDPGYFSSPTEAYAVYADGVLTFYQDSERASRPSNTYFLNTGDEAPGWRDILGNVTKVVFDPSFASARPTSTAHWFSMRQLTTIEGLEYLNTREVTTMYQMFSGCSNLTELDVSTLNTEKVASMYYMFQSCDNLTSITGLENFDTGAVTNMGGMFNGCEGLTSLDLRFNTENVTSMAGMFQGCTGLTELDLSAFNTEKVTDMSFMFESCSGLKLLNLGSFNTARVTNMEWMFCGCENLTTIFAGDGWTTNGIAHTPYQDPNYEMFSYCNNLVGGNDTHYINGWNDLDYARIDGKNGWPGYLTDVASLKVGDVDKDGSITDADVQALVDIVLGKTPNSNPKLTDVNGDGSVTIADVTKLVNIVLGNE